MISMKLRLVFPPWRGMTTTVPTTGVVIRDTPGVPVSKKEAPAKGDRVGSVPKVVDESQDKTTGTNERTDSGDDDSNEVTKDDDDEDDVESDANDEKEASDSEKTDSDEDENLNANQNDDEEEVHKEEDVRTPDSFEFNDDDEEYDELYKDVNVRSKVAEHEEVGKGDAEMTDTTHQSASQENTINESHENFVLAKSSSQPQSTYEAAASHTEFELKKILLDKLEKSKSYRAAKQHGDLHDALVKSYQLNKDLFDSYGKAYSLKRGREHKDKDEDPPAGSDQGLKKRKTSKDSDQAEEPVFETADTEMPQDQRDDLGNTEDQPNVEESSKHDWFKKPKKPPTPDRDWNAGKQIDFRPPQTWISKIAKVGKPPLTFDELMSTPIDFSAYVLNNLKIENLTQEYLVGPAFNLLNRTCKSRVELEYHFEECYKAVTDKLDWTNPKGHEYPFDLSKPLPLIED
ncbi:hypothetical protein Tco_0820227 [Tanacetum coccineum]|uniref:Uncharacterized protein n=1 Tax=Tanacetum coccineum TaxID=301880 RepID=A0ABQ5AD12_9ASTR